MTTGRINQVTIVNANKGPLWRLPPVSRRKRFVVTFVMAPSPECLATDRLGAARSSPRGVAAGATAGFRYPLPGFPGRCRQAQLPKPRRVGKVPPRRPKRRPAPRTSAIQRPSTGRYLLLLVFQAWPAASHPQSPSSGAERTDPPTPSGIPRTRTAWADCERDDLVQAMNPS